MKRSLFIFLTMMLLSLKVIADPVIIKNISVTGSKDMTHVTVTFDQAIKPRVFTLQRPDRVVMDIKNARSQASIPYDFDKSHLLSIRDGYPQSGLWRLVLDVNAHIYYRVTYRGSQTVIDLTANKRAGTTPPPPAPPVAPPPIQNAEPPVEAPSAPAAAPSPAPAPPAPPPAPIKPAEPVKPEEPDMPEFPKSPLPNPLIIAIDPGHGGKDPGAIGDRGIREKDIVLAIARRLAALINREPNMRAVLTRNGDYYVSLRRRLQLARTSKADLFIAIHADSYFNNRASGASVYVLSPHGASSTAARWLAQRENYSELGGVDLDGLEDQSVILRSVLLDLAQTATNQASVRWGNNLLGSLSRVTKLHYEWVEKAPFMVLKSPDIPSILVETGFISNVHEEKRLSDKIHQDKIAEALFKGITTYRKKYIA